MYCNNIKVTFILMDVISTVQGNIYYLQVHTGCKRDLPLFVEPKCKSLIIFGPRRRGAAKLS